MGAPKEFKLHIHLNLGKANALLSRIFKGKR